MTARTLPLLPALLGLLIAAGSPADDRLVRITLEDGSTVEGRLVDRKALNYRVQVGDDVREIAEADVRKVEFVEAPADEPAWKTELLSRIEKRQVTVAFNETPLDDVLLFLNQTSGVPIVLDPVAGADDAEVSLDVSDISLRNVLELVAALQGLEWKAACGAIVLSTRAGLARFPLEPPRLAAGAAADDRKVAGILAERRATLQFSGTPMQEVLAFLNELYSINLVVDADLGEKFRATRIDLALRDQPLDQALSLVCALAGARYVLRSGVVFITE